MPKSVLIRLNDQNTKEAYSFEKQYNTDNGKIHKKYRRNIQRSSLATGAKDRSYAKASRNFETDYRKIPRKNLSLSYSGSRR